MRSAECGIKKKKAKTNVKNTKSKIFFLYFPFRNPQSAFRIPKSTLIHLSSK
jgi:hypothetical protein